MTIHSEITAWLGCQLQDEPSMKDYSVYYDHGVAGEKNVCEISSVIGNDLRRENKISEIDLAILDRAEKVIFLLEIEESDDNPKKLIGDVMATLLGDKIFIKGEEKKRIGEWTTLIIYAKKTGEGHEVRIEKIEKRIKQIISNWETNSLNIKNIKIALFKKDDDLKKQVIDLINSQKQKA